MNHTQGNEDRAIGVATGVKTAVFICVLGSIVMIADRTLVTPSEPLAPGMTSLLAPSEATALSADGRVDAIAPIGVARGSDSSDSTTDAPATSLYPAPAADAVRDEGGHPPTF